MSLTEEELFAMKERANEVIDSNEKNELAARIAADVLMLLLFLKMVREKK